MTSPTISGVQIVPGHSPHAISSAAGERVFAVGLVIDDSWIAWGDCLLPQPFIAQQGGGQPVLRLKERITPHLRGQCVDQFRRLVDVVASEMWDSDELLLLPSVRAGVQQALLAAVAHASGRTPMSILTEEYELTGVTRARELPLILNVPNIIATAERIAEMVSLAPAGIGYQLATGDVGDSIGPDAEYLQQFVRELATFVPGILPVEEYNPALLLRLHGALGVLAGEPRQHLGKVLGNVVGLESAANLFPLWLVDPILLDDVGEQAGTMKRLRQFIHRRDMATRLVCEGGISTVADLDLLLASEACDAILVAWGDWADLNDLLRVIALCADSGLDLLIAAPGTLTPRQLDLLIALTSGLERTWLVMTVGCGLTTLPAAAKISYAERRLSIAPSSALKALS